MGKFAGIVEGTKNGWNNMDKKRRGTLVVLVLSILLFVSIFSYLTQKVNYVSLFSNLEPEDAGNIVNDLDTKKMKYKLENNGMDIKIDEKFVDQYRLQLAMEGMMPENSTGFEIFDDMGLMVTDDDRQIMYQRALTGELQRSIMSLEAVSSAKVHLVMPEKSIFDTEKTEATASIIIDVKPNKSVTADMVKGIAALVSGAVDNLPEKNIQVIDSKGTLLSGVIEQNEDLTAVDVLSGYRKVQDEFESKLETNLNELIGSAFGKNKIKVSVYADLDFNAEETTLISYDNPVIRSEEISASGGGAVDVQKVTGGSVDDNVTTVVDNKDGSGSTYDRTVNNELTTETKTTVKAPGKVNKLTTSVVYDGNITEAEATTIRNIVSTATGYDINRGDLISVEGVAFDKSYEEGLQKELDAIKLAEQQDKSFFNKFGEYLIFGLVSILAIIILIALIRLLFFKKKSTENTVAEEQLAMDSAIVSNKPVTIDPAEDKIKVASDNQGIKAKNYAKENPDIAADLIKAWIKD